MIEKPVKVPDTFPYQVQYDLYEYSVLNEKWIFKKQYSFYTYDGVKEFMQLVNEMEWYHVVPLGELALNIMLSVNTALTAKSAEKGIRQ